MNATPSWLPPMICMDGVWKDVLAILYEVFDRDFKQGKLSFAGRPVWWDRTVRPGDQYEEGFWHLITREDTVTEDRLPDFRRAKRLPWCVPTIRHHTDAAVLVWDYKEAGGKINTEEGGKINTYVWLEQMDYVIILRKRQQRIGEVAFLITAYHVDGPSRRRTLRRKHERRCP